MISMLLQCLIVITFVTVALSQPMAWCNDPNACSELNCFPAFQENGCFNEDCICGTHPYFGDRNCQAPDIFQSNCPTNCSSTTGSESLKDWVLAINGCPSCVCRSDVPAVKPGTCPPNTHVQSQTTGLNIFTSNTPQRVFDLSRTCTDDYDCGGIQKCCQYSAGFGDRCVNPEPTCPEGRHYSSCGKTCRENSDCDHGDACCGRFYSKKCVKGVLPTFPPVRYNGKVITSPDRWA